MRHSRAVHFDVWTHMIFRAKTLEFLAVKSFVSKGKVERERRCHFSLLSHVLVHCIVRTGIAGPNSVAILAQGSHPCPGGTIFELSLPPRPWLFWFELSKFRKMANGVSVL